MTPFDLDAEFAAATVRVNTRINRAGDRALRRIHAATPGEIRDGIRDSPLVELFLSLGDSFDAIAGGLGQLADEIAGLLGAVEGSP